HPAATSDGKYVYWAYGSDDNTNNNVATYVSVMDNMCNTLQPRLRISDNNNANDGAPDIVYHPKTVDGEESNLLTAGYFRQNTASYAVTLNVIHAAGTVNVSIRTPSTKIIAPGNIGRPTIVATTVNQAFYCAA